MFRNKKLALFLIFTLALQFSASTIGTKMVTAVEQTATEKDSAAISAQEPLITPSTQIPESLPKGTVDLTAKDFWGNINKQDKAWYGTDQAAQIADNMMLYQHVNGGWPKNIEMQVMTEEQKIEVAKDYNDVEHTTIDNSAVYIEMTFLAKVYTANNIERYKQSFLRGLDYIFVAQYENGGWPQYYPNKDFYRAHITFNDNAMLNIMTILRSIVNQETDYQFIDEDTRQKAASEMDKGIDCILKTQIIVGGQRTVWCQQHDEITLQAAMARSYELVSQCSVESANILKFLMAIDNPTQDIKDAIHGGVKWFNEHKIEGIRVDKKKDPSLEEGEDMVITEDPNAKTLWTRFYDIETGKPFFCGRDGVMKFNLSEIEHERRVGYQWYNSNGTSLISKDYPKWQEKWDEGKNVLVE